MAVNPKNISVFFIFFAFLFLRIYKLHISLFYFNDMGRDSLVLLKWQQTNKPPLLGPQNSAIPFNQSPLYFYLLYPLFLLTNGSPFSAIYTNLIIYIFIFIYLLLTYRKKPYFWALYFSLFLVTIHPEQIFQSRFVWNPSLVSAFLLLSFWSLVDNQQTLSAAAMAIAIACSFSVVPTFLSLCLICFIQNKHKFLEFFSKSIFFLFIFHLPILLFELRHHFQLTRSVLLRGAETQHEYSYLQQIKKINEFLLVNSNLLLLIVCGFAIFMVGIYYLRNKNQQGIFFFFLLLSNLFITIFLPINFQSHYIFGLLINLAIFLSFLPNKLLIITTIFLLFSSLRPKILATYFGSAPRTYDQMKSCFQIYCQNNHESTFVSVQSIYHPFHYGPEHRYLLNKAGCVVKDIEDGSTTAKQMTVVVDGGDFVPHQTSYNELSLFGPYQVKNIFKCQRNFQLYQLIKIQTDQKSTTPKVG